MTASSPIIEALGDYRAKYAYEALATIARLDGPLLDDCVLALGKIGDARALDTLATLQHNAVQPSIAAAICLLGVDCERHESFLKSRRNGFSRSSDEPIGARPTVRQLAR